MQLLRFFGAPEKIKDIKNAEIAMIERITFGDQRRDIQNASRFTAAGLIREKHQPSVQIVLEIRIVTLDKNIHARCPD